jgi:sugar O-acyltransferase (sialic acid O-acetyltransferase NeuD family)
VLDKKIILIGYSGHGFVVADTAIENQLNLVEYAENSIVQNNPFHLNYAGNECDNNFFEKNKETKYLIGIGDNTIREKIYNLIIEKQCEIVTLISQSASISKTASIGNGTFVNKNVAINALAKVGKNVILNTACVIEHDCVIGGSVHIAPGAVLAGNVYVGDRSFIGANAVVKQGVVIGKDVIVGAGSVVINDIPDGKKIAGNPTRVI